jgi:hypothetical protein
LKLAWGRTLTSAGPGVELADESPPAPLQPQIPDAERRVTIKAQAAFLIL